VSNPASVPSSNQTSNPASYVQQTSRPGHRASFGSDPAGSKSSANDPARFRSSSLRSVPPSEHPVQSARPSKIAKHRVTDPAGLQSTKRASNSASFRSNEPLIQQSSNSPSFQSAWCQIGQAPNIASVNQAIFRFSERPIQCASSCKIRIQDSSLRLHRASHQDTLT
jgi:hypothetical protein